MNYPEINDDATENDKKKGGINESSNFNKTESILTVEKSSIMNFFDDTKDTNAESQNESDILTVHNSFDSYTLEDTASINDSNKDRTASLDNISSESNESCRENMIRNFDKKIQNRKEFQSNDIDENVLNDDIKNYYKKHKNPNENFKLKNENKILDIYDFQDEKSSNEAKKIDSKRFDDSVELNNDKNNQNESKKILEKKIMHDEKKAIFEKKKGNNPQMIEVEVDDASLFLGFVHSLHRNAEKYRAKISAAAEKHAQHEKIHVKNNEEQENIKNHENPSVKFYHPIHDYQDTEIYKCVLCDSCYIYRKSFLNHLMKVHHYTRIDALKMLEMS